MSAVRLRDAGTEDHPRIVAINAAEVAQTSSLDEARLSFLSRLACYHKVAVVEGEVAAFVLAMRSGAPYENDNFAWFARRFDDFLYVDRIVVAAAFGGRGIGRRMYTDLFDYARSNRIARITCEYNLVPPNPASAAFHARFGFRECGTQWLAGGAKQVSLQAADA